MIKQKKIIHSQKICMTESEYSHIQNKNEKEYMKYACPEGNPYC